MNTKAAAAFQPDVSCHVQWRPSKMCAVVIGHIGFFDNNMDEERLESGV